MMKKVEWIRKNEEQGNNVSRHGILAQTIFSQENYYPIVADLEHPHKTKEKLIFLLKIAAEVEHRLMVQYLYAMYSISDENDRDVKNLKKELKTIAIQEMGHLLAVQNLLLAVGGVAALHLHKDQFLTDSTDSNDNPLPYSLEPFSKELLAAFVAVEAPANPPQGISGEMAAIFEIAERHTGGEIRSVGGLYERIFWLMQADDNAVSDIHLMQLSPIPGILEPGDHIGDDDFIAKEEIEKYEAYRQPWNNDGTIVRQYELTLDKVHDRDDALRLINEIAEQGEGADFVEIDSHFERFFNCYNTIKNQEIIVFNTPKNVLTAPRETITAYELITNEYSLLWAQLFNSCYSSLLLDIHASFFYRPFNNNNPAPVISGLVYKNMSEILGRMSCILFQLPLRNDGSLEDHTPRCGPTFEIDKNFRTSAGKAEMDSLHGEYIKRINNLITTIKSHTFYEMHADYDPDLIIDATLKSVTKYANSKLAIFFPSPTSSGQ